ncbi:Gfo/Idh/MocA family oxidoreductase [Saccharopolyspora hirsuta]|uniref:Gfo/Idh/MocA family oxidoreductase n=1 Tax=Saccharopolyspora hirsuta TaxID=1837 RepID=A0A5M7C8F8_SACHI|nr:Gfo/Idh/MocA family oxidoreductase [Saccharopolyspora hirsuta]KAA5835934.1 Gfo/Idh/MocA family oxidoreductase [Saccharopolyspora hirsuta]
MSEALRVGVIGAGPWAHRVHAPGLAAHRGTRLAAVWARRSEAAEALAEAHGAEAVGSFEELLDSVDAVAFAVPPAVQAELAPRAARAGKHLVLEKPLADDPAGAEAIVEAVTGAGVAALMMLTRRFDPEVQRWLAGLPELGTLQGATGRWLAGGLLAGDYAASAWRQQDDGALIDAGPHAIDLLDAALGDIEEVHFADRGADGLWQLVFGHEGGTTSTLALSLRMPVQPSLVDFAVYGEHGCAPLTGRRTAARECYAQLLDNLLVMIREKRVDHPCGVHRGLHLQRVLADVLKAR